MKKHMLVLTALLCVVAMCLPGCTFLTDVGLAVGGELSPSIIYSMAALSAVEIRAENSASSKIGSGFFYDNKGTVITNYHVIENCTDITVWTYTGESYKVQAVLGYDAVRDIAILETDCTDSEPLRFGTEEVYTGQKVYTLGSSLGLTGTFSDGMVSCAKRILNDAEYIQVTAPISPGNSGGPLLDATGHVIGINSACIIEGQNLNFAIPIGDVSKVSQENTAMLDAMFTRNASGLGSAKLLQSWSFAWSEEKEGYVLCFELCDKNGNDLTAAGTVEIEIVNDKGETVYKKTRTFTAADFIEVEKKDTKRKLAGIVIAKGDIAEGTTPTGTVSFRVQGIGYAFEIATVRAYDLPLDS